MSHGIIGVYIVLYAGRQKNVNHYIKEFEKNLKDSNFKIKK